MRSAPPKCRVCGRILSGRGRPNQSGLCSNCHRFDPIKREKWKEQLKSYSKKNVPN